MTDDTEKVEPKARLKMLRCRRTGQEYDTCTHKQCPYCFGEERDIESGEYENFCDFQEGEDPVSFGFPDDTTRRRSG